MNNENERDNYGFEENGVNANAGYYNSEETGRKGGMITPPSNEDEEEDIILMGEVEDMK